MDEHVESDTSIKPILGELLEKITENEGRTVTGVASGYRDLDELTTGFQPGELIVLAALPCTGKTSLALNITEQAAFGGQPYGTHATTTPVAFFSYEMPDGVITRRLLTAKAGVDAQKFRRNMLSRDDHARLHDAAAVLADAPIEAHSHGDFPLEDLLQAAARDIAERGTKLVVVDSLNLLRPRARGENRYEDVTLCMQQLKAFAMDHDISMLVTHTLKRPDREFRERPRIEDWRESSSVIECADLVMHLHREEQHHEHHFDWKFENPDKVGVAELTIAKQRNGPTEVVKLTWNHRFTRFTSHAKYRDPAS